MRVEIKPTIRKTCEECKAEFLAKLNRARFCKPTCKVRAHERARRQPKAEPVAATPLPATNATVEPPRAAPAGAAPPRAPVARGQAKQLARGLRDFA